MGMLDFIVPASRNNNPTRKFFTPDKGQMARMDVEKKGVAVSEVELSFLDAYGTFSETGASSSVDIQTTIQIRLMRKLRYREMSLFHIIRQVLEANANDAVAQDKEGRVILPIISPDVPEAIRKKMEDNANKLWYGVCDLTNTAWELYLRWLIEGEQAVEWVVDDKAKAKGIVQYRVLPSATIVPNYERSQVVGYLQYPITFTNANSYILQEPISLELNQVGYSNYGVFGTSPLDVIGYLETAIRPYNHLKAVEDSLMIARITRAPERRVWNVDVGMMSRGKISEYIQRLIQKFRRRVYYNPATGEVDSHQQMLSVLDDIWLPKQDGKGTTIETAGGTMDMGKMDDVIIFNRNLYRSMKYPKTRWSDDNPSEPYALMKADSVNPEEVGWSRFVNRCRGKWGQIWLQGWMQHNRLTLTPKENEWNTTEHLSVRFVEDNLFELNKSLEFNETRMNALATAQSFIKTTDNPDGMFAKEFVLKRFFMMTDEEWEENEDMLKKEAEEAKKAEEDANADGGDGDGGGDNIDDFPEDQFDVTDEGTDLPEDETPIDLMDEEK